MASECSRSHRGLSRPPSVDTRRGPDRSPPISERRPRGLRGARAGVNTVRSEGTERRRVRLGQSRPGRPGILVGVLRSDRDSAARRGRRWRPGGGSGFPVPTSVPRSRQSSRRPTAPPRRRRGGCSLAPRSRRAPWAHQIVATDRPPHDTSGPLAHRILEDVEPLRSVSSKDLRDLGRLPYPMLRRRGDRGFHRISWDEALGIAARRIRATTPDRLAFFVTSRGMTNESYYVASKVARFLGTNHIDNSSRPCHSPSTTGLKET